MHPLNILNMYIQCLKDWGDSIRLSVPITSPRALLLLCINLHFHLALHNEHGLQDLPDLPSYCPPLALYFSHTGLCWSFTHLTRSSCRVVPSPWATLTPETHRAWSFIPQVFAQMLPSQRSLLGILSLKAPPTPPLLSPFLALFPPQHLLPYDLLYIFLIFVKWIVCLCTLSCKLHKSKGFGHFCLVLCPKHLEPGWRHCTTLGGTLYIAWNVEYDVAALPETVPGT